MLRKLGQAPARGTTRLKYRLFFLLPILSRTSDLTRYFKNILKFCEMFEANLLEKTWKLVFIMVMIIYFSSHNSK